MAVGEHRSITVEFPADYGAKELAGKPAVFGVALKALAAAGPLVIDDDLAKGFGFADLATLKGSVRANIEREYGQASRAKWKRALLDTLDKKYAFDLPQGLVEQEFESIWRQAQIEQAETGKTFADENTTEEAARADYRAIAERRVRLGLVLAEIGEAAGVKVTEEEVNRVLLERVRQYPGEEKKVWDFFRNNPRAMAQIQAPLFEDKVIDHVAAQAQVTERKVTKEELTAEDPEEDEAKTPDSAADAA
jgi:trigger factor